MKTIILVRHAKSGWDEPGLSDIERPLNKRGHSDAPFMGKIIAEMGIKPDVISSSSAVRAITTATYFAKELNFKIEEIKKYEEIYEQGMRFIISLVKELSEDVNTVMIFGHNPDITSLASFYSGDYFDNLSTCGVVCIDFKINKWSDSDKKNGKLRFHEFPKKHLSN